VSDANKTDIMEPISNDEWFKSHIQPKLDKIIRQVDGMYFINVGLCWDRHKYNDAYEGKVGLSIFPKRTLSPQDWTHHWAHSVRFLTALHNKLKSFDQEFARVDLRVYLSGASGCRQALIDAFNDNVKRIGLPHFKTPFTWKLLPMNFNTVTRKYDEKPDCYSFPQE